MSGLSLIAFLSLVSYRVTRFVVIDTIWEDTRRKLHIKVLGYQPRRWRDKLHELLTCPYCISVWIAAGTVIVADWFASVPLPVLSVPAVAAGTVVLWRVIEE